MQQSLKKQKNFFLKNKLETARLFNSGTGVSFGIQIINIFLFISYFAIKGFGDIYMRSGGEQEGIFAVKHFILLFGALFLVIQGYLLNRDASSSSFFTGVKSIMTIVIVFTIISLIHFDGSIGQGYQTLLSLLMILYPGLYVFSLFQIMSYEQVFKLVKLGFIIYALAYLFVISGELNVYNFMSMNFVESYSPFENSDFSSGLIGFFLYFCAVKTKKKWILASALLNFLVFKRVAIVFMPILLFVGLFYPVDKQISSKWKYFFATVLLLSTLLEFYIMQPDNMARLLNKMPNIDPHYLFMGRNDMFENLLASGFQSAGLNSTNLILGRTFEIESLKLLLEMGLFGYVVFCFSMWKITSNNLYSTVVMIYFSIKVLSSSTFSSSSSPFMMLLIYLAIASRNEMTKEINEERSELQ